MRECGADGAEVRWEEGRQKCITGRTSSPAAAGNVAGVGRTKKGYVGYAGVFFSCMCMAPFLVGVLCILHNEACLQIFSFLFTRCSSLKVTFSLVPSFSLLFSLSFDVVF